MYTEFQKGVLKKKPTRLYKSIKKQNQPTCINILRKQQNINFKEFICKPTTKHSEVRFKTRIFYAY